MRILKLTVVLFLAGCSQLSQDEQVKSSEVAEPTTINSKATTSEFIPDVAIRQYNNTKYRVLTDAIVDSASNALTGYMHLLHKSDTMLAKQVNADTLLNVYRKFNFASDSIPIGTLHDYRLTDLVLLPGIRDYKVYYAAKLSRPDFKDVFVWFTIKVRKKPFGKIHVGRISYHSYYYDEYKAILYDKNRKSALP